MAKVRFCFLLLFFLLLFSALFADPFTEIAGTAGVTNDRSALGVAVLDFDLDGLFDIYITNQRAPNRLYKNLGGMVFEDVAPSLGVDVTDGTHGVCVGDVNNDFYPDIFMCNYYIFLYLQDGFFIDVTDSFVLGRYVSHSAAFGDIDNDGFLDLFVTTASGSNRLFRNIGGTGFVDITSSAGVDPSPGRSYGVSFADVNGDGFEDIYVVYADSRSNRLLKNNGDLTFTDMTSFAGVPGGMCGSVGVTFGDVDNDGDLDIFVCSGYSCEDFLYRNDGDFHFTNISAEAGVSDPLYGRSAQFLDSDNDGDLDLFIGDVERDRLFSNDGTGHFVEVTASCGISGSSSGMGNLVCDFDNDGDIDIFTVSSEGRAKLYRNNQDDDHFIQVRPVSVISNKSAIGTKVFLYDEGHLLDEEHLLGFREISSGSGYMSCNANIAHFGVLPGEYDILCIFPSGIQTAATRVPNGTILSLVERDNLRSIRFSDGINFISLPVETEEHTLSVLFPFLMGRAYMFSAERRRYNPESYVSARRGYVVLSTVDTSVYLVGNTFDSSTYPLYPGWNLIGANSFPVEFVDPDDSPDRIVITPAYWFDPDLRRYVPSDTLHPGRSYWVLSLGEGRLNLR